MKTIDLLQKNVKLVLEFFHGRLFHLPLAFCLWLLLWGGLNTGPGQISDFLHAQSVTQILNGLRALLPIIAAYFACLAILMRYIPKSLFQAPLGLYLLYGMIGILSSLLFSPEPVNALYWVGVYISVFAILGAILSISKDPTPVRKLTELNWVIISALTVISFIFMFSQLFQLNLGDIVSFLLARRFEPRHFEKTILGMPMVRATGMGRYAGVLGLVAIARLLSPSKSQRQLWKILLVISFLVLWLTKSKTAILSWIIGIFLIFGLQTRWKLAFSTVAGSLILLVTIVFFAPLFGHVTGVQASLPPYLTSIADLSGRISIWGAHWHLFRSFPILGYGFHSGKLILNLHAHNAILHSLVQTGLVGTIPFFLGFVIAWVTLFRLLRFCSNISAEEKYFLVEIAGVLAFLTARSLVESTGAFFGVDWLLLAPMLAYITILYREKIPLRSSSVRKGEL